MAQAAAQLQEQLLSAQANAEEAHAAAKLKQIEHENQSQQLTEVSGSSLVLSLHGQHSKFRLCSSLISSCY